MRQLWTLLGLLCLHSANSQPTSEVCREPDCVVVSASCAYRRIQQCIASVEHRPAGPAIKDLERQPRSGIHGERGLNDDYIDQCRAPAYRKVERSTSATPQGRFLCLLNPDSGPSLNNRDCPAGFAASKTPDGVTVMCTLPPFGSRNPPASDIVSPPDCAIYGWAGAGIEACHIDLKRNIFDKFEAQSKKQQADVLSAIVCAHSTDLNLRAQHKCS